MFTVNAQIVLLLTSLVLPALVAAVTKVTLPSFWKMAIAAVLAGIAGLINAGITQTGEAIISKASLVLAGYTFAATTLAYLGLYRPLDANAKILPTVGI